MTIEKLHEDIRLIIGDARNKLAVFNDNTIPFIAFSPPYGSAKNYSNDQPNDDDIGALWDDNYHNAMSDVIKECHRILCPGRKMCINVQDIPKTIKFEKKDYQTWNMIPWKILESCIKAGFILKNTIIWKKSNMRNVISFGTFPFPPSPVMMESFEYIFVFQKPGKADYSHVTDEMRRKSRLNGKDFGLLKHCVWTMKTAFASEIGHPAPFPVELITRLIKLYSFYGEEVLDPFVGSGTTFVACINNGRKGIGIELYEHYKPIIIKRVNEATRSGSAFSPNLDNWGDKDNVLPESEDMTEEE
jgi:DNA modification methylase